MSKRKRWLRLTQEGQVVGAVVDGVDLSASSISSKSNKKHTHFKDEDGTLVGYVSNGVDPSQCETQEPNSKKRVWNTVKNSEGNTIGIVRIGSEEELKELI
jgi:hypothetical protein